MSIEQAIIEGNSNYVHAHNSDLTPDHVGALFLLAVTFEQEAIALDILSRQHEALVSDIVEKAFKSAVAHNEVELVEQLLHSCPEKLAKKSLLGALRMAVAKGYEKILTILAKR